MTTRIGVFLLWAAAASFAPAQACADAACFGSPTADPLFVSGAATIAADAVLDFGPRHLVLSGAQWTLLGSAQITAAKITMDAASSVDLDEAAAAIAYPPGAPITLTVATTATGGHDGAATFAGPLRLGVAPANAPAAPASFVATAVGALSVATLETDGDPAPAGWVSLAGASVTVGTILAGSTGADGPVVTIAAAGDVALDTLAGAYAELYFGASVSVVAGGHYTQTGSIFLTPLVPPFAGASVSITAGGTAALTGAIDVGDASPAPGGAISVVAAGDVVWHGAARADGGDGGRVEIRAAGGDVFVSGSKTIAATSSFGAFTLGAIDVVAARDALVAGVVAATSYVPGPRSAVADPGGVRLRAGRDLVVANGASVGATAFGPDAVTHDVRLQGCRVTVEGAANVLVCNAPSTIPTTEGSVFVTVGDRATFDGPVSAQCAAANPGAVVVEGRLPALYGLAGASTPTPAPVYTFDPTLPPCLADFSTTVVAPSPVAAGGVLAYTVTGPPGAPLFVAVAAAPAAVSLGSFGFTQIDGFGAAVRLVDAFGIVGPPLPGATDAAGEWTFSYATPASPALSGLTLYFEAFLFDGGAANGLFHQPRAAVVLLN